VAPPSFPGGLSGLPAVPDAGTLIAPPAAVTALTTSLQSAGEAFTHNVANAVGEVRGVVRDVGLAADREARTGSRAFGSRLAPLMEPLREQAGALAGVMTPAVEAAGRARTGLEEIAGAYERWLTGGGMNALLGSITEHFRQTPLTGPSIPAAVAAGSAAAPSATVQIDELVVEVAPPSTPAQSLVPAPLRPVATGTPTLHEINEELEELRYRGLRDGMGPGVLV
jgi:hypothetical protein